MSLMRILGIVVFVVGLVMLGFSHYINTQVLQGQAQIQSAQQNVDTATSVFSATPATKQGGKVLTSPIQSRIDAGSAEAAYYAQMAKNLQIGGFVCLGLGIVLFIFGRKKTKR